jgi:hypothetical protein
MRVVGLSRCHAIDVDRSPIMLDKMIIGEGKIGDGDIYLTSSRDLACP